MLNTWQEWVGTETGVVLCTMYGLPFAVLAVLVLALRRRAAGAEQPWRMSLAEVGIVYGTVPWVWLVLLPGEHPGNPGSLSLVPLRDLFAIIADERGMATGQIVGNLLVFAALGFFGPIRFAGLASLPRVLALAAGSSITIEVAQYVLRLDRVSSVDDVLLNTAGAVLAAVLSYYWWRARTSTSPMPVPVR
jgi:glycopeptide antibiotics resistance protein